MSALKKKINALINLGTSSQNSFNQNARTKLNNKILLLLFCLTFPYTFIFYPLGTALSVGVFLSSIGYIIAIYANKQKHPNTACIIMMITANFTLLYFSIYLGNKFELNTAFIAFCFVPWILFEPDQKKHIFGCISMFILSFFVTKTYYFYNTENITNNKAVLLLISSSFAFASFLIIVLITRFYFFYLENTKKKLSDLVKKLKISNENLNKANSEIIKKSKIEAEFAIARNIQTQFLPSLPQIPHYKIDFFYQPSVEISGDFLNIHAFGKNKMGFMLTDVTGKGLQASFTTIRLHAIFHSKIKPFQSPKDILSILNNELYHMKIKKNFCACFYFELDYKKNQITYSDAGIGTAYLIRNNQLTELREAGGITLGAIEDAFYTEATFELEKKDILIIGSDGIQDTKNKNNERYSQEKLEAFLKSYSSNKNTNLKTALEQELKQFQNNTPTADDISFITIEYN